MLIEENAELVRLSRDFVCMKFCETDDRDEYYRAAAYFLPQWYWQPILAITDSEGREINPHWRKTHESVPPAELEEILRSALEKAGRGMEEEDARRLRGMLDGAEESLVVGEFDEAIRICACVRSEASPGRILDDAERIERAARFLASVRGRIDEMDAAGEMPAGFGGLLCALYSCTARDYGEAWKSLREIRAAGGSAGNAAADAVEDLRSVLEDCLLVLRVSARKWRFGPDLFHEIRTEVRTRLDSVEGLGLEFGARLGNCAAYGGSCEFGTVRRGSAHRASMFVPFLEADACGGLAGARVRLFLDGCLVSENSLESGEGGGGLPSGAVRPMTGGPDLRSWWGSPGFEPARQAGAGLQSAGADPLLAEIRDAYVDLDARRYYFTSNRAKYRLASLGSPALRYYLPLATRDGGVTTLDLLWILARIPDEKAAAAVLHNLGADDATLRHPGAIFYYMDWLDGQEYAPAGECIGYLAKGDAVLAGLAASALGRIGKKEALMPLFERFKRAAPDSRESSAAVEAISSVAGREFGFNPALPAAGQREAAERFIEWWKEFGEGNPRILWMARSIEEAGFAQAGKLAEAVLKNRREEIAPVLIRAVSEGRAIARRCAISAAMHLGIQEAGPAILDFLCRADAADRDLALARNSLRRLMTKELLENAIGRLAAPGKGVVILDLLLVSTGNWGFYPPEGGFQVSGLGRIYGPYPMPEFRPADIGFSLPLEKWEKERSRWALWLENCRDRLMWDGKELRFKSRD